MNKSRFNAYVFYLSVVCLACSNIQVSAPKMNLLTGVYSNDVNITVETNTDGAIIYYTTDGTTPTRKSTVYSLPIQVAGDGTVLQVKAIAVKKFTYNVTIDSEITSETYFINYGNSSSPVVISTTPISNTTNINIDIAITATFSKAMDPATINASTFKLQDGISDIGGTVTCLDNLCTFTPLDNLSRGITYVASITEQAKDISGNRLPGTYVWFFTTDDYYSDWMDMGIVYEAPGSTDAYYPSVVYDSRGFGLGIPQYAMWYSNGSGNAFVIKSSNGSQWGTPTQGVGLTNVHHVQVLYNDDCFGTVPCLAGTTKYRIWFWDTVPSIYDISAMATAESSDGINWINKTALTQNAQAQLVSATGWNRGTYGPVFLFYQPSATNTGIEPWNYSYVMYYDGTDGSHEDIGLAYSTNGLLWNAYTTNPILEGYGIGGNEAWDCWSAVYGTVIKTFRGFHFFYSGKGQDDGVGGCQFSSNFGGIGYAFSTDGKSWIKNAQNPILHVTDGATYRDSRTYTPSVVEDDTGKLKMYYSAAASTGGPKKIGMAVLE